jgi:hypothetical protein
MPRGGGPKKTVYELVDPDNDERGLPRNAIYQRLNRIIAQHHPDLAECRFLILFHIDVKADKDNRLRLAWVQTMNEESALISGKDVKLTINKQFWIAPETLESDQDMVLDHECCHIRPDTNEEGEQKTDERGRKLYRMRGHEVEEFVEIIERHGYQRRNQLVRMVEAAGRNRPAATRPPGLLEEE